MFGLWFEAFGAYFFTIGILGLGAAIYYSRGFMILFLVLFNIPGVIFIGYGAWVLGKLDFS